MKAEGRHTAILLLTDVMKEGSLLLMVSDDPAKITASAWKKTLGSDNLWLEGVMSRKKAGRALP
ncbi:MAG: DHHA2 domain-containing protein [Sutterella seckii]